MPECTKCGNTVFPASYEIDHCVTSQPCPICGKQNYLFPARMMQAKDGAEIFAFACERCGDRIYISSPGTRKYCDDCLRVVRSKLTTARNNHRRLNK